MFAQTDMTKLISCSGNYADYLKNGNSVKRLSNMYASLTVRVTMKIKRRVLPCKICLKCG